MLKSRVYVSKSSNTDSSVGSPEMDNLSYYDSCPTLRRTDFRNKRKRRRKAFLTRIILRRISKRKRKELPSAKSETTFINVEEPIKKLKGPMVLMEPMFHKPDEKIISRNYNSVVSSDTRAKYSYEVFEAIFYASTTIPPVKPLKAVGEPRFGIDPKIYWYAVEMARCAIELLYLSLFTPERPTYYSMAATTCMIQVSNKVSFVWSSGLQPGINRSHVLNELPTLCHLIDKTLRQCELEYHNHQIGFRGSIPELRPNEPRRLEPLFDVGYRHLLRVYRGIDNENYHRASRPESTKSVQ